MKEGVTVNFNAPIINNGGTITGDIVNPTFVFGEDKKDGVDKRKTAIQCMEAHIQEEVAKPNSKLKNILAPYVAAIRAKLVPNNMNYEEFNQKYGTDISASSFSEYVPKEISNSKILEDETEAYEREYSSLLNL